MYTLHYHCQHCNVNKNFNTFNVTCVEKLKEYLECNLITIILYNKDCNNCKNIRNESIYIDNDYEINEINVQRNINIIEGFCVYNIRLIETFGFFLVNNQRAHFQYFKNVKWVEIDDDKIFDLIKGKSLLKIHILNNEFIHKLIEMGRHVECVQRTDAFNYYIVKPHVMTKPARK